MFKSFTAGDKRPVRQGGAPPASQPAPVPLARAVTLMYSGAAATVLYAIFIVIAQFATKNSWISLYRSQSSGKSVSQLNSQFVGGVVFECLLFLIMAGLWVMMARMSRNGRSWARMASTVLFILWTLSTYGTIGETHGTAILITNTVLTLAIWVIGLGAVFMLWRPESSRFFQDAPGR